MFSLIVIITANTHADIAPLADALARMRPLCLAEPGCLHWEAYQSQGQPGRFVLVEHWQSQANWETHDHGVAIQDIYVPDILPLITREVHPSRPLGHS